MSQRVANKVQQQILERQAFSFHVSSVRARIADPFQSRIHSLEGQLGRWYRPFHLCAGSCKESKTQER